MKRLLVAFTLLVGVGALEAEMTWKTDPVLANWQTLLPAGWTLTAQDSTLILEAEVPVFVLTENRINAPLSRLTQKEEQARIRAHGQLVKPRLVYTLTPPDLMVGRLQSARFTVALTQMLGVDDDFHSVENPAVSAQVWALKTKLEASLALVVTSLSDLEGTLGRRIIASVSRSRLFSQHRQSPPPGYPFSEYVDLGGEGTVLYSKVKLTGPGPWTVVGRAEVLEPTEPDPQRKETIRELHLVAEEIRQP